MDQYQYEQLLKEKSIFQGNADSDLRAICVHYDPVKEQYEPSDVSFKDKDVGSWLRKQAKDDRECRIKLLFTMDKAGPSKTALFPIIATKSTWQAISDEFQLPMQHLQIMKRQGSAFFYLPPSKNKAEPVHRFILQSHLSQSRGLFSAAFTVNVKTRSISGFIHGLEDDEMPQVISRIKHAEQDSQHPLLVPLLLVESRVEEASRIVSKYQDDLFDIERTTGLHNTAEETRQMLAKNKRYFDEVDFNEILRKLTGNATAISFFASVCQNNVQLIRAFETLLAKLPIDVESFPDLVDTASSMRSKMSTFQDWTIGIESRCEYLAGRAQTLAQTVHSLIAQRDNASNIKIARLTYQDSITMRGIAIESKAVSMLAAKDSASMTVIAAVTILFLPATFTATLFSTVFFDFDSANMLTSRWQWLYWVITAGLTLVVHTGWWFSARLKRRAVRRKIERQRNEQTQVEQLHRQDSVGDIETYLQQYKEDPPERMMANPAQLINTLKV